MSGEHPTADKRDCGGDVAAYALGALDQAEVDVFRAHLETCSVCKEELASFQDVVNALPLSAPPHPAPAAIRGRVMREVNADARTASAGTRRTPGRTGIRFPRAPRWLVPRPVLAAGVLVVLALAVFAGIQSSSTSNGARVIRAQVTGGGRAELRIVRGHASLVLQHFSPPPAGKIYELWVKRGNRPPAPTSALFSVTSSGSGDVDVPGSLRGVSLVMVTPEPAGGSLKPTHAPVISVPIA
jgi:hypothetical protein